jgi:hypothetical protein
MINLYSDVLSEKLISDIKIYINDINKKNLWGHSDFWDEKLRINSSKVITHTITYDNCLFLEIKSQIENKIKTNFDDLGLEFGVSIYFWGKMTCISWHDDVEYPFNGTVYLNEKWNSDDGGIFLWRDNKTNEIKGFDPEYNTMVVNQNHPNDEANLHCVTMISPSASKDRVTLQWRCIQKEKLSFLSSGIKYF